MVDTRFQYSSREVNYSAERVSGSVDVVVSNSTVSYYPSIMGLQRHSDGVFDQRDDGSRVQAMGGDRPHTQSEDGQSTGCTEHSDR